MKGISKILAASIALMKLEKVYSASPICGGTYDPNGGQQVIVQPPPSYILVPNTSDGIANCAYNPQTTYVPPSTPGTTIVPPTGPSNEEVPPTTPTKPPTPGPEDVGTCKIAVVKHCDTGTTPGTGSCETPEVPLQSPTTSTVTQTVAIPQQPPIPVVPVVEQPKVLIATMTPHVQPATVMVPSATMMVPPTQQMIGGVPGFSTGVPSTTGTGVPGIPQVPGTPGQGQSGQCSCSSTPQVPNPIMPPSMNVSGNGYPASITYNPNIGPLGSCIDMQKSSCEQKRSDKSNMQYTMESCTTPTPTVIIGNSEYLVGPTMYNTLNSAPCNNTCQC